MKIKYSAISKTGKRRNNEDAFLVIDIPQENRLICIVCDGMGGHACGEVASETVCYVLSSYWEEHTDIVDCETKVKMACKKASLSLDEKADALGHIEMGTTMVMASIKNDIATIAHIGDSRCYLQRSNEGMVYQTKNHIRLDFGWEVVAKCFFAFHPEVAEPEVKQFRLEKGDRILLCTDGLYKSMSPSILQTQMMENKSLNEILDAFSTLCEKQGDDNYTAVLIEVL